MAVERALLRDELLGARPVHLHWSAARHGGG
jgi:hypothetical protein